MKYIADMFAAASKTATAYLAVAISGLAVLPDTLPQYWGYLCDFLPHSWSQEKVHHALLGAGALAVIWTRVRRQIGS
jgi:hypothetical protein